MEEMEKCTLSLRSYYSIGSQESRKTAQGTAWVLRTAMSMGLGWKCDLFGPLYCF